jgi:hypothetical protein
MCSLTALAQISVDDLPAKTGLSYEALTKFYQSTVTTGENGGFDFKSSLFGIHKLFAGRRLELSSYYTSITGTAQRNTELSIGIMRNGSSDYTAVSGGLKYAIINKRDKSKANFFKQMQDDLKMPGANFNRAVQREFALILATSDTTRRKAERLAFQASLENFNESRQLSDLPTAIRDAVKADWIPIQNKYDSLSKAYDQKGLLTLSAQSGYDFAASSLSRTMAMLQYTKGLTGNADKPYQLDARANWVYEADTTIVNKSPSRQIFSISLGVNKTLLRTGDDDPFLEFELAADYTDIIEGTVYAGEYKSTKNGVATLRLHLTKEFTLPVVAKFDVEHANLLGFIQVQWNLEKSRSRGSD